MALRDTIATHGLYNLQQRGLQSATGTRHLSRSPINLRQMCRTPGATVAGPKSFDGSRNTPFSQQFLIFDAFRFEIL